MANKKNTVNKKYNFPEEICVMIEQLASETGVTNTEAVINSITFKYNSELIDEHIILGRITQLQKKLDQIDKKLETFTSLIYYIIPYFLAVHPELPKDKDESRIQLKKAAYQMSNMVKNYRKLLKTEKISFIQSVFGDTQETLEQTYMEQNLGREND